MAEAWLRGPVPGVPHALMPAAHSFIDAGEELEKAVEGLDAGLFWVRPGGVASVGFHLRHVAGSTDRLLTYARGEGLDTGQLRWLAEEGDPSVGPSDPESLIRGVQVAVQQALQVYRDTPVDTLFDARLVGRSGLPSTVIGLLFHAAEHARRHAGQVIATAAIVRAGGSDRGLRW